jgi:glycosyltransferase involved in cell wall biosynthesis
MSAATLVSIVVPAYNHARFLRQAIDSVLAQTYPAVELIVLDDGSTDDTARVLAGFGKRFYWETQANMGQAASLNKGWAMARGGLLGYLSADDYLYADAVASAVQALERNADAVLAYPDFVQVDEASRPLRMITAPEFSYEDMLARGVCAPGPGTLFRRSAYAAAGGWDARLRRIPDFEFLLRLCAHGRFVRIPQPLAGYRIHAGGQSFRAVSAEGAEEIVAVIEAALGRAGAARHAALAREARANALLLAARLHIMSGRWARGLARAAAALRADPLAALRVRTYRLIASGIAWRGRSLAAA